MKFRIYELKATDTGRISIKEVAQFLDSGAAMHYAKTESAKQGTNLLCVNTETGSATVHAPFA